MTTDDWVMLKITKTWCCSDQLLLHNLACDAFSGVAGLELDVMGLFLSQQQQPTVRRTMRDVEVVAHSQAPDFASDAGGDALPPQVSHSSRCAPAGGVTCAQGVCHIRGCVFSIEKTGNNPSGPEEGSYQKSLQQEQQN